MVKDKAVVMILIVDIKARLANSLRCHLQLLNSIRISSIRHGNRAFRCTAFGQSAFSVKSTNQWKTLSDDVMSCSSISTYKNNNFKKSVKGGSALYSMSLNFILWSF